MCLLTFCIYFLSRAMHYTKAFNPNVGLTTSQIFETINKTLSLSKFSQFRESFLEFHFLQA